MAPATRRSSGLGTNGVGTSNLDHILEHFNQFKRKHITQNRDIIKTNALAQLRIKELEEKVLALEAERTDSNRDIINIRRRMENAEKAALCMRQGWQMIGAGVAALSSIEGFGKLMSEEVQEKQYRAAHTSSALLQQAFEQAAQRPSARIILGPNVLPGGVVRNVAIPPDGKLDNVIEEESAELAMMTSAGSSTLQNDSMERYERTIGGSLEHDDENDSDENDVGDLVSFSAEEEEETIRIAQVDVREDGCYQTSRGPVPQAHSHHPHTADSFLLQPRSTSRPLHHASSIDSLSSFADDEEVELSTDDERCTTFASRSSKHLLPQSADQAPARKRKTPSSSPQQTRRVRSSSAASTPSKDTSHSDDNEDLSANEDARPSRRASMRDRKSINYALPKLNTKMRKPDPIDLVPAAKGEQHERRRDNSSSEVEHAETTVSSDTINADTGISSVEQESPRRRKLKGKHEAASTGNLREIRRQHEQQHQQSTSTSADESNADEPKKMEEKENVDEGNPTNFSPRRLSARRSLRERNSSEDNTSENDSTLANVSKDEVKQTVGWHMAELADDNQSLSDFDHSIGSVFAQSVGTPIPKSIGRTNENGGIKALSMVNRLNKIGAAPIVQRPTARQIGKPLHQTQVKVQGNGGVGSVYGKTIYERTNGSTRPFVPRSRSVSANSTNITMHEEADLLSLQQSAPNGDPAKRHSLHAAMTSPNMTELGMR